ncbi:UDP-glucose--hexose-1-phosphate uridylyltransferase [Sphingorhabdus sp.]|uniref:UDP-glucose--hexose-1-phosphate uridylyltransferase n=1 Tax=Sphingorhabdus sp. TaxID=1902408 RepID=UPI0032B80025
MNDMPSTSPHRRFNPLTGRWVLVSPQRSRRPWLGQLDEVSSESGPSHDPSCYLCPGSTRANGNVNADYAGVWIFDNDFPALLAPVDSPTVSADNLFHQELVSGTCRVICFSPDHSKTLPELSPDQLRAIIDNWAEQSAELGRDHIWVQLFENKGAAMGCSNPHPHGQIWASSHLPDEPAIEDAQQRAWLRDKGQNLLLETAEREADGPRVVVQSEQWLAIVPWWASWPFETLLLPRFPIRRVEDLDNEQRDSLALALRELTTRYDNLFRCSFPYSMGWHGAPYLDGDQSHWQLHAHFYPPLLRSASVRKFMVGYEMLADAQRDLTPEQAAQKLREQSTEHFRV